MSAASGLIIAVGAVSSLASGHSGHAGGPQGLVGWLVVAVAVVVDLFVVGLCAKYFLSPGESSPDHIKRRILQ